jgi:hypothetical protein
MAPLDVSVRPIDVRVSGGDELLHSDQPREPDVPVRHDVAEVTSWADLSMSEVFVNPRDLIASREDSPRHEYVAVPIAAGNPTCRRSSRSRRSRRASATRVARGSSGRARPQADDEPEHVVLQEAA